MDFSGMSLIKLRKEEMESQVSHGTTFDTLSDIDNIHLMN